MTTFLAVYALGYVATLYGMYRTEGYLTTRAAVLLSVLWVPWAVSQGHRIVRYWLRYKRLPWG